MAKLLRQLTADELCKEMGSVECFLLFGYNRFNAEQTQQLRRTLSQKHIKMKVVKNTIASLVLKKKYNAEVKGLLTGSMAIVYGESPVDIAKIMIDWSKKFSKNLAIKGGYLSGQMLDLEQLESLSKTPSREVLLGMLAGVMQSPIQQMASVLSGAMQNISYAIDGYMEKLEKLEKSGTPTTT